MKMFTPATKRGLKWELLNSLWVLWTFAVLLNFIAFLWIGGRAKRKFWTICGIIYFTGVVIVFAEEEYVGVYIVLWFISIIHAFIARKKYLKLRDEVIDKKELIKIEELIKREQVKDALAEKKQMYEELMLNRAEILANQRQPQNVSSEKTFGYSPEKKKEIIKLIEIINKIREQRSSAPGQERSINTPTIKKQSDRERNLEKKQRERERLLEKQQREKQRQLEKKQREQERRRNEKQRKKK